MRLADITPGAEVYVTRGYSRRAAVVTDVRTDEGKVGVRFTDAAAQTPAASIPDGYRGGLYGATVRPNAVTPR